jgi:hypothetical protein
MSKNSTSPITDIVNPICSISVSTKEYKQRKLGLYLPNNYASSSQSQLVPVGLVMNSFVIEVQDLEAPNARREH